MNIILPGEEIIETPNLEFKSSLVIQRTVPDNQNTAKTVSILHTKCAGVLNQKTHENEVKFKFSQIKEKYVPSMGDKVIGKVLRKMADNYEMDVRSDRRALLGVLSFQGATKKSKPNLTDGDLVFCQIQSVPQYLLYKVTCISSKSTKIWNSGEAHFGHLSVGIEIIIPLFLAFFLSHDETLFELIRKYLTFEVVVGINGILWFRAKSIKHTLLLSTIFKEIAYMEKNQAHEYVKNQIPNFA